MTDNELRALRDINRQDKILVDIINRIILSRRNGQTAYADRLEARVKRQRPFHIPD